MSKLEVSYSEDKIVFTDTKSAKAEGFAFVHPVDDATAAKELRKEVDSRVNVSRAALSLLVQIMQNSRLAGYKGASAINTALPKEFKAALRDVESAVIRPLFLANISGKLADTERDALADKYMTELRSGGVYPVVKNMVSQYFGYLGYLPCVYDKHGNPDVEKLLSCDAMKKLIANAKADAPVEKAAFEDKFVNKIVTISQEWNNRTEQANPKLAEAMSALAALKSLVASFEGIVREAQGSVSGTAVRIPKDAAKAAVNALAKMQQAEPATV